MALHSCRGGHLPCFCMSLRGAKRRGNPYSLRQHVAEGSTLGEYAATTDLPEVVPPCQVSLRGRGLPHQCAHWFAMTCKRQRRVSRCKDVPPLSLRGAKRRGNPYSLRQHVAEGSTLGEYAATTDLPEVVPPCQVSLRGRGLPHQCAHWFAMTCRRRGRGYVCKDVSAMDTLGRGRGLPRLVAPKSAMSSPQSPPCPAPAKGQSRATLPWGSSPHKGCPFAGPRGYAGQRPEQGNAPLGLLSPQRVPLCGAPCTGSQ